MNTLSTILTVITFFAATLLLVALAFVFATSGAMLAACCTLIASLTSFAGMLATMYIH